MNPLRASVLRRLAWGLVAAIALPWALGEWFKQSLQPGLTDHAASATTLVDYVVVGGIVAGLSLWVVAAFACLVVGVMKGPRFDADAFPPDAPRPGHET
jgi:hypothetical protein